MSEALLFNNKNKESKTECQALQGVQEHAKYDRLTSTKTNSDREKMAELKHRQTRRTETGGG